MDPLSITVSAITIAGTIVCGLEALKNFNDAPGEIQAVANEISDLQAVLGNVESMVNEHDGVVPSEFLPVAMKAKSKLLELNHLITTRLLRTRSSTGETNHARLNWLRYRNRVREMQAGLRDTKLTLCTLLGAATAFVDPKFHSSFRASCFSTLP